MHTPSDQRSHLETIAQVAPTQPTPHAWPDEAQLPQNFTPECPRCGYDLSGQAAVAREQSPRPPTGTCSECGLSFEWRLVLSPGLAGWLWFIESAGKRLTRACLITTWRALNPPRFWRDVRLETQVVPQRIARWAVTTFGILFLALSFLVLAQAVAFATVATRTMTWTTLPATPGSRAVFSTPTGLAAANPAAITLQSVLDSARQDLAETWNLRRWGAPRGPITLMWAIGATLMAPLVVLALPHTRARAKVRHTHILRATAYSFCWLVALCLWSMVLRTVELALTIADILRTANPTNLGWGFTMRRLPFSAMEGGFAMLAAVLIAIWLAVYWSMVLSRGWRMRSEDALPATLSIFACSFLAGLALAFWVGQLI